MHLEKERLEAFQSENMSTEEWMETLQHISSCNYCADQLDSEQTRRKAPVYLKEQMMQRVQKLDVQTAVTVKRTSRKAQLLLYGLKTAAAVLAALLMLFAIPNSNTPQGNSGYNQKEAASRLTREINDKSNAVTEFLNKFSYNLIQGNGGNQK